MTKPDLKVVGVVCGCDFNNTRSEFRLNIFVGDYRNLLIHYRQDYRLAYEMLVTLVVRVNGYCCIAEHCLRTGCGEFYIA